jgi:putative ABC transport system permease protein
MLRTLYLYRNLTRNVRRSALTCAAVALPIMIYVLSMAVVDGVEGFLDNSAKQLRLAVTQKTSIINPLPSGHRAKIEALDPGRQRLLSVCGMRWIGGKIERDPRLLSTLAADVDTFVATFPDYQLTPKEVEAWTRDRQALIVGPATAGQFGWHVGDRVTILPSVPPYTPMEFHIISTAPEAKDRLNNWCRRDYLEEKLKEQDMPQGFVSFYFVKCTNQADLDYFRVAIDDCFARSPDETKTQDEKAFMNEFVTQQFDLPRNLSILAGVTVFVAVMAAANTMSMNFRDRANEVAILKSMGFSGTMIFTQIQAESLLLCGIGGVLGALTPYVAFMHTPLKDFTVPLIQHLEVPLSLCGHALLVALLIGLVAAIWPSWQALRMKVVVALRNLE